MERYPLVKKGYDPAAVDADIQTLENVIKSYKEKDNAIKNAIISAQVAADNVVKNAKMQADEYKLQIVRELENVRREVERERAKVQEFHDIYSDLVRRYLTRLDSNEISGLHSRLNEIDRLIDHLMETDSAIGSKTSKKQIDRLLEGLPEPNPDADDKKPKKQ